MHAPFGSSPLYPRCYVLDPTYFPNSFVIIIIIIIIFIAIGLSPGGSGYFTCIQNMKLVPTEFRS